MMNHIVADTAHDGASYFAHAPCAHHDHNGLFLFANLADRLARFHAAFVAHADVGDLEYDIKKADVIILKDLELFE